ncbi:hypothetical protein Tco_1417586 [Tanacetum coccineum]
MPCSCDRRGMWDRRPLRDGWTDFPQEPSILGISLKRPLSKGTIHHQEPPNSLRKSATSSKKETRHYTKLGNGALNRQLLESQGPIPGMTPVQALTAIQTMADHSQKWHDGSSSRNIESSSSFERIDAIVNKLENLGRDMKKLKENVHAIQVGCQNFWGAKYGEFGRPLPFSNEAKYRVGPPGYYTRIDNRPPVGEKMPSLEELMNKHLEKSTRRRTKMEEWIKKLQENAEINTRNQASSLKNLETQIEQLTKEFHTKAANEINNPSLDQCKEMHTNEKTPINNRQHEISVASNKGTQIV